MRKLIIFLTSIILFFLILLSALNFVIFDKSFYEKEFEKNKIYEKFGKEKTLSERDALLDYFKNNEKIINSDFYNEKEKQHLFDVKNLMILSRTAVYLSFFILVILFLLVFLKYKNDFLEIISKIFVFSAIVLFSFSLIAFFMQNYFSRIFYDFHLIFFSNNLWLLNPVTDNLINLFPEKFFFDAVARIIYVVLLFGVLFFLGGIFLKNSRKII